jgi:hypothetical protein
VSDLLRCAFPGCFNIADSICECCNDEHLFCGDHGTLGGDRQVQDVGAVAVPSACWKCGGFNADE